jgi:membrane protease YdiL (CAAX protease family)
MWVPSCPHQSGRWEQQTCWTSSSPGSWRSRTQCVSDGEPGVRAPGTSRNRAVNADTVPSPTPDQFSFPQLVALHLVPGALVTVGFVAFAPVMEAVGFPPIAALMAAIVVVLVPLELGIVLRAAQRDGFKATVPYRRSLRGRDWLWLVPALIVAAFVGFGVHMPIEPWLIDRLFGWLPEWFVSPVSLAHVNDYGVGAWSVTLGAFLVLNGVVGPVVEELYFRGFLLPRMERLGRWAPIVNVSLFSFYHFWSPWQILARIIGIGPMVYAVHWKRNVYLGMIVHGTLNLIGVLLVTGQVQGRL